MSLDPLLIDYFAGDNVSPDELDAVARDGRYIGAVIKATEGLGYDGGTFFKRHWPLIATKKGYGETWFRGCYHYLKFDADPVRQADFYLRTVDQTGSWGKGDLWPIVDVELGGERDTNRLASRQRVIDCTSRFAGEVTRLTGRGVMLYGNGAMRDLGIHERLGCTRLWLPRYTADLPAFVYTRAGWEYPDFWQYGGDGTGYLKGYPTSTPTGRKIDHSVLTLRGGLPGLRLALTTGK